MNRTIVKGFYYAILSFFYLATAATVFFIGMGLGLYNLEEIRRPHTDIFLVIVAGIAFGIHHLNKQWIPKDYYHIVMIMGTLFFMLPILFVGTALGLHS